MAKIRDEHEERAAAIQARLQSELEAARQREADLRLQQEQQRMAQQQAVPEIPELTPPNTAQADFGYPSSNYGYYEEHPMHDAYRRIVEGLSAPKQQGVLMQPPPMPSAVPQPEGDGGGIFPDLGTALKTGVLDVASLLAGAGAMAGELGRRVVGREEPFGFQEGLFNKYQDISQQSAMLRQDMNDPWETFKGLFGQSETVNPLQAITRMPATIMETVANQAPFMALTLGTGSIFAKAFGSAAARGMTEAGKVGMLSRRAEKFMLDEGMRTMRRGMSRKAWKAADKAALRKQLKDDLGQKLTDQAMNAYAQRMGMNTGVVAGTGVLEGGGMFGEAAEHVGMDNVSLGTTALLGTLAGMVELSMGGGNLNLFRRYLGHEAEREAIALGRRAAVASAEEIPSLGKKAAALMGRLAKESGIEAAQEGAQEFLAITNLAYNAPESIQDIDILGRMGSSMVVGGMMGFGPSAVSEFVDWRSARKPDPSAVPPGGDPEAVGVPISEQVKHRVVQPNELTESDKAALRGFGAAQREALENKPEKTRADYDRLDEFMGQSERGGPNYLDPEYVLERFVNQPKREGKNPLDVLNTIHKDIQGTNREGYVTPSAPFDPIQGKHTKPTGDAATRAQADHAEQQKRIESEAKVEESRELNRQKSVNKRKALMGYYNSRFAKLKGKKAKQAFIDDLLEKNRRELGPDFTPRTAGTLDQTAGLLIEDVVESKVSFRSTLTDVEAQEYDARIAMEQAGPMAPYMGPIAGTGGMIGPEGQFVAGAAGPQWTMVPPGAQLPVAPTGETALPFETPQYPEGALRASLELQGVPASDIDRSIAALEDPTSPESLELQARQNEARLDALIRERYPDIDIEGIVGPIRAEQELARRRGVEEYLAGVERVRPQEPAAPAKPAKRRAKVDKKDKERVPSDKRKREEPRRAVPLPKGGRKASERGRILQGEKEEEIRSLATPRKKVDEEGRKKLLKVLSNINKEEGKKAPRENLAINTIKRQVREGLWGKTQTRRDLLRSLAVKSGMKAVETSKLSTDELEKRFGKQADKLIDEEAAAKPTGMGRKKEPTGIGRRGEGEVTQYKVKLKELEARKNKGLEMVDEALKTAKGKQKQELNRLKAMIRGAKDDKQMTAVAKKVSAALGRRAKPAAEPTPAPKKEEKPAAKKEEPKKPRPTGVKNVAMRYKMPAKQNIWGQETTTLEAAEAGKRTATTRTTKIGDVGQIITFEGRPQQYEITGVFELTKERAKDPKWLKRWSELEGWTVNRLKQFIRAKGGPVQPGKSYITKFKRVGVEEGEGAGLGRRGADVREGTTLSPEAVETDVDTAADTLHEMMLQPINKKNIKLLNRKASDAMKNQGKQSDAFKKVEDARNQAIRAMILATSHKGETEDEMAERIIDSFSKVLKEDKSLVPKEIGDYVTRIEGLRKQWKALSDKEKRQGIQELAEHTQENLDKALKGTGILAIDTSELPEKPKADAEKSNKKEQGGLGRVASENPNETDPFPMEGEGQTPTQDNEGIVYYDLDDHMVGFSAGEVNEDVDMREVSDTVVGMGRRGRGTGYDVNPYDIDMADIAPVTLVPRSYLPLSKKLREQLGMESEEDETMDILRLALGEEEFERLYPLEKPAEPASAKAREAARKVMENVLKTEIGEEKFKKLTPKQKEQKIKAMFAKQSKRTRLPKRKVKGIAMVPKRIEHVDAVLGYEIKEADGTPRPNDFAMQIMQAFVDNVETFTSELLDNELNSILPPGKKAVGRPTKAEPSTKTRVYSTRQMMNEMKGEVRLRQLYNKEVMRSAIQWFREEFPKQKKKGFTEQKMKGLPESMQRLWTRMMKTYTEKVRSIMANRAHPSQSAVSPWKTAAGRKPGEKEQSLLGRLDPAAMDELLDTVGSRAVFRNFYKIFLQALDLEYNYASTQRLKGGLLKLTREAQRKLMVDLFRARGWESNEDELEAYVQRLVKRETQKHHVEYFKSLAKNRGFLVKAMSVLRKGDAPQEIPYGMWEAIISITASSRNVTEQEFKDEYAILHNYLNELYDLAYRNELASWNITDVPDEIKKKNTKVKTYLDHESAKELGLDKLGWGIVRHKTTKSGLFRLPKAEGLENSYGWRADYDNANIHVSENFMFSDQVVEEIRNLVAAHEVGVSTPHADEGYQKNFERLKQLGETQVDLMDQQVAYIEAWVAEWKDKKNRKQTRLDRDTYVNKKKKDSKKFKTLDDKLKKVEHEIDVLTEKNDQKWADAMDHQLKIMHERQAKRAESLAAKITDEVLKKETGSDFAKKKFRQKWEKNYKDQNGKKIPLNLHPLIQKQKLRKEDWRLAVGLYYEYERQLAGYGTGSKALDTQLTQPFVERWWKETAKDPKWKGRPSWNAVMKEEEIIVTPKEGEPGVRKVSGFRKYNIEQKEKWYEAALNWSKAQREMGGAGAEEQAIMNATQSLKRIRANMAAREAEKGQPTVSVLTIQQQLDMFRAAKKMREEELKKKVARPPKIMLAEDAEGQPTELNVSKVAEEITKEVNDFAKGESDPKNAPPPIEFMEVGGELPKTEEATETLYPTQEEYAKIKATEDIQILEGLASGQRAYADPLWAQHYAKTKRSAYRYLIGNFQTEANAEDVAQTLMAAIAEKPREFLNAYKNSRSVKLQSFLNTKTRQYAMKFMEQDLGMKLKHGIKTKDPVVMERLKLVNPENQEVIDQSAVDHALEEADFELGGQFEVKGVDDQITFRTEHKIYRLSTAGMEMSPDELKKLEKMRIERQLQLPKFKKTEDGVEIVEPKNYVTDHRLLVEEALPDVRNSAFRFWHEVEEWDRQKAWIASKQIQEVLPTTKAQKSVQMLGRIIGTPIVYVKNMKKYALGLATHRGVVLLDDSLTKTDIMFVFGHELWHAMEFYAKRHPVFATIVETANDKIRDIAMSTPYGKRKFEEKKRYWMAYYLPLYEKQVGKKITDDRIINAQVWKEFRSDISGSAMMHEEFWQKVEGIDPTLVGVMKKAIRDIWDAVRKYAKLLNSYITKTKEEYEKEEDSQKILDSMVEDKYFKNLIKGMSMKEKRELRTIQFAPDTMADIIGEVAYAVSRMRDVSVMLNKVVYIDSDAQLTDTKFKEDQPSTLKNITKGLLEGNRNVVPVMAEVVNSGKYGLHSLRQNIYDEMGRVATENPQKYLDLYPEALLRLDTMMFPDHYGENTRIYHQWLREYVNKDLDSQAFQNWFGQSRMVNAYFEDGDTTDNDPRIFVVPAQNFIDPITEDVVYRGPAVKGYGWTNKKGEHRYAIPLGSSTESVQYTAGAMGLNFHQPNMEYDLVAVRSEKPFDLRELGARKEFESWLRKNMHLIDRQIRRGDMIMYHHKVVHKYKKLSDIPRDLLREVEKDTEGILSQRAWRLPEFWEHVENLGYDSILVHDHGQNLIVFDTTNVKSIKTNRGSWLRSSKSFDTMVTPTDEGMEYDINVDLPKTGLDHAAMERVRNLDTDAWDFTEQAMEDMYNRDKINYKKVRPFMKWFMKTEGDMAWYDEIISNAYDIRKRFPEFTPVHEAELRREKKRYDHIHRLTQSPFKPVDAENTRHELFELPYKERLVVTQALQLGDKHAHNITEEEFEKGSFHSKLAKQDVKLPRLTDKQKTAFYATRATLSKTRDVVLNSNVETLFKPYLDTVYYPILRELVPQYWDKLHMRELTVEEIYEMDLEKFKRTEGENVEFAAVDEILVKPTDAEVEQMLAHGERYLVTTEEKQRLREIFHDITKKKHSGEDLSRADTLWMMRGEMGRHPGYFPRNRKNSKYVAEIVVNEKTDHEQVIWNYRIDAIELKNLFTDKPVREYAKLEEYMNNHPYYGPMLKSGEATFRVEHRPQMAEDIFGEISPISLAAFSARAVKNLQDHKKLDNDTAEALISEVFRELSNQLKARGFSRHSIKRSERFIPGFEEGDGGEILYDYITSASGQITKQEAAWDYYKAMEGIDPAEQGRVFSFAKTFAHNMLRNTDKIDAVSAKLRGGMFTMFLAGSLKPPVVNFTQNFISAIAEFSKYTGVKEAHSRYFKAMKDVSGLLNPINILHPKSKPTINWKNLSEDEQNALHEAIMHGITIDQYVRELMEFLRNRGGSFYKIASYLAKPFSFMEQFNRASAFLTMYRYQRDIGVNHRSAMVASEGFVYDTHYLIGKANMPQWAGGDGALNRVFLKNAMLFRSFTHNFLLQMRRSLKDTPEGRNKYTTIMVSMAYIALFGGMLSVPFMDDLMELIEKITKTPWRSKARKMAYDGGYDGMFNAMTHGLPAALGADISGSIAITAPWTMNDAVFGVWGGMFQKIKGAKESYGVGDYARAVEQLSPMFISHPMRAIRGSRYSMTTPSGAVIHDWEGNEFQYTTTEAFWRGLGFRPAREAVAQMDRRSKDLIVKMMEKLKFNINKEYVLSYQRGDKAGQAKAMKKAVDFNKELIRLRLVGKIPLMTYPSMGTSLARRQQARKKQLRD